MSEHEAYFWWSDYITCKKESKLTLNVVEFDVSKTSLCNAKRKAFID